MKKKVFFTFQTFQESGIADQLGCQFAHLYALGIACGMQYIQVKPFVFNRQACFYSRRKHALIKVFEISRVAKLKLYRNLFSLDPIVKLLGLDVDSSLEESKTRKIKVSLNKLLDNASSLPTVTERINQIANNTSTDSASVVLFLETDHSFYDMLPNIRRLCGLKYEQILDLAHNYLWLKSHQNIDAAVLDKSISPDTVSIHIRIGDSIFLPTDSGPLILHGAEIFFSLDDYVSTIMSVDSSRNPFFYPYELSWRIKRFCAAKGIDLSNVCLLSDGFAATTSALHRAKPRIIAELGLKGYLSSQSLVHKYELLFRKAFAWVPKHRVIIGENASSTAETICRLATSRLNISSNGGFAYSIQKLYGSKKYEQSTIFLPKSLNLVE